MTAGPSSEQRRYSRVPINLEGLIGIAGRAPVACTVRDFCVGGMFISADPQAYAALPAAAPAVLFFALFVDGVKQDFQIQLLIARTVAKGIGVSFVNPDAKAVELLGHLAAASAPPPAPANSAALGRTQEGFAPEFAALAEPLAKLCGEQVLRLCVRFVERVDEVLFMAARDAGNNVEQNRLLDGQREMRARRGRICEGVPRRVETGVSILADPIAELEKDPKSVGLADLSLIDKDDFEEFLVMSEMVSELEPEFSESLFALGRRFSFLANREVDLGSMPIGPGVLCNAISDCMKGMQSDRRTTARIYKVLHEIMSGHLGNLYDAVNALLIERGILTVIEKDKPPVKKRPAGFDAPIAEAAGVVPDVPVDEALVDLMPGPENYQGRAPAPAYGAAAPVQGMGPGQGFSPPAGYAVQGAPPSMPPGNYAVQGAQPSMPAGAYAVQGAQPSMPSGGYIVQGAVPSVPAQAYDGNSAGMVAQPGLSVATGAGSVVVGGAPAPISHARMAANTNLVTLPAGWVNAGGATAPPTMQQAYSTAQAQLALRRQFVPDDGVDLSESLRMRGDYSRTQVLDGLSDLQGMFAATSAPGLLNVAAIKQRITEALIGDGAPHKLVGGDAADAIEVVANLFGALLHDAFIAKSAKDHLTRLQPSVHKAAMLDQAFFASTAHPVRQMVDRIAQLRDGKGASFEGRSQRIDELVVRANREFRDDVGVFAPMVVELDRILSEQRAEYEQNVQSVVASCEHQQRVLEERRGQSLEATDQSSLERPDLPEEWNRWLERGRELETGQRAMMNANTANSSLVTLVWKEPRNHLFVFVDEVGNKSSTLTLQQVAMYLRRGILRVLDTEIETPPLERAMLGVVDQLHSQVEEQATCDPLTGFLTRRFFAEAIDAALSNVEGGATKQAACCHISIENLKQVNDEFGVETGDGLLKGARNRG